VWELSLPNTPDTRRRLADASIDDISLILTFSGQTPDWP
jgi:hypothetical protein